VNPDDLQIRVRIDRPSDEEVAFVEDVAAGSGIAVVVPPVHFAIETEYAGQTREISRFSVYVERRIAIPEGVDPGLITTAVVVEPDGTIRHAPTVVEQVNGQYYAVVRSMTNSMYVLVGKPAAFADMANHWAEAAVSDMGARMIVNGTPDGRFEPERRITRAEFAAILVRGLGLKADDLAPSASFTDVSAGDWYIAAVRTASQYGLVQGYADGSFRPAERITREQAAVMLSRAMALTGLHARSAAGATADIPGAFTDANDVSVWAAAAMADSVDAGLITGRSGQRLAPNELLTRAETAVLVQRLLQRSGLI
jgi:S-layer homology domain.